MQINHNSTLARYKSKLGALKTGEATQIYVFAQDVCNVKIKIECEEQLLIHDMSNCDGCWSYEFVAPPTPCVVFYTFSFSANNHDYILCAANSTGQADCVILPENAEDNLINPFQITIYDKDFITPDWVKNGVMYQIFPDRFCRGNKTNLINGKKYHEQLGRTIIAHENWDEEPICTPINGNEDYFPCDFYGGDLIGIEQQLDYLQSLSVTVIYLNPICEASSNHRYDTANYMKVDPILGSNYDFSHLCDSVAARGIKIIIDGVFSHTGSDSVYFNKNANYSNKGAYQGEESPFYSWYKFHDSADDYESWWGFKTLPEVEEQNKDWQKYIITSKNGVFYNWLNMGANGIRLDVADELPDNIISLMRTTLKNQNNQNFLLGEVWEDATTKQSYGQNRKYALGNGLDSVMNYPFRDNCLSFLLNKITAFELCDFLTAQALNYPAQMYYCLMNLISSHDVARAKTVLASQVNVESMSRLEQSSFELTHEQEKNGEVLLKLATVLQFAIPGMPSIYYGDEQGMSGLKDPFNRRTFSQKNVLLQKQIAKISALRRKFQVLKTGDVSFLPINDEAVSIIRFNAASTDFFGNPALNQAIIVIINVSDNMLNTSICLDDFEMAINQGRLNKFKAITFSLARDVFSDEQFVIAGKSITLNVSPKGFKILWLN